MRPKNPHRSPVKQGTLRRRTAKGHVRVCAQDYASIPPLDWILIDTGSGPAKISKSFSFDMQIIIGRIYLIVCFRLFGGLINMKDINNSIWFFLV